jgi:hypothetical protein
MVIVDVAGVVAVADKSCCTLSPPVEAIVVDCADDVVEHSLECRHVLRRGPLHEAAEVSHDKVQIRPSVDEIAEAADELAV